MAAAQESLHPNLYPAFALGEESVWTVVSGTVDLFLADRDAEGRPAGRRTHLGRQEKETIILGLGDDSDLRAGVLICPAAGSRVELRRRVIAETELEQWIDFLALAAAEDLLPRSALSLDAAGEVELPAAGAVQASGRLIWLSGECESLRLLGDAAGRITGPGFFPLTRRCWVAAAADARLTAVDTETWRRLDPEALALRRFHACILQTLTAKRARAEQAGAALIRSRAELDSRGLDHVLRKLTRAQTGKKEAAGDDLATTDPLVLACQATARAAGIVLKVPPNWSRAASSGDPVNVLAQASGARSRRLILRGAWWKSDGGPMLAFIGDGNHPVALLPSGSRYILYDPATRTSSPVNAEIAGSLTGSACMFYRPFPGRKLSTADLLKFALQGNESDLVKMLACSLVAGALGMVTPIVTGRIFDTIIPGAQRSQLLGVVLFTFMASLVSSLFSISRGSAMLRMETRMSTAVQSAVWDRLLKLPLPFFREYSSGDLALRGMGINQIRETLTGSVLTSFLSGMFSVFSFVQLFIYSVPLALAGTALVLVVVLATALCSYFQIIRQREIAKLGGRIAGLVFQLFHGIAKLRVSGTESRAFAVWAREYAILRAQTLQMTKNSQRLGVFYAVFPILSTAAIFYCLMQYGAGSSMTTGSFLAFNAAYGQFLGAALSLSSAVLSALAVLPALERARPILDAVPEAETSHADPGPLKGNIELGHIQFRYHAETPLVLQDVSFRIRAGEFVAFVGASGSGKSTLLRLLLGFEKPESGAVYFDGQDLSGLDAALVRRQIGTVLQSGTLLSGDLFRAIVGDAPLTLDDAWEAARLAGLDDEIRAMPMGMNTMLSDGGGGLSGGQRQRLMIARAVVGKPRILLFDEATSALDNRTQATVTRSLAALDATRIVIAHRLSTIGQADRIFVMRRGAIVESGSYRELMQANGAFTELAKRQLT